MTSYIISLSSPAEPPLFEIAVCETETEAREWADQLLAFAPGFEVSAIRSAPIRAN